MRFGPLEFNFRWRSKTWDQLDTMISREQGGIVENLKGNSKSQLESYRSWVYSCVSLISDRISSLPYSFYNKDTGEELSTKNKGYKVFTKTFTQPNEFMSFRFIKGFCQIQLDLCGMACIYKAKNRLGQVWELWPLNMNDFIKVETNGSFVNPQVKYVFKTTDGTGWMDFDINELVVINYSHPTDPWNGMSPIQSQAYASDIDQYVEVYERDFFKNSARIDFALSTDTQLDQEKADELKARWLEKYRGSFHDVAVLDSGLKPIPLNYTNRDFEFLNLAGWSKEKILGCYRVPANKLGSTESNRAGSVYSDISFNRESVHPRLNLWDEEMTMGVCMSFDERLEIRHQNPIPRDRQIELQEGKSYLSGVPSLTVNEFRERNHKLPPVEGGDEIIVPQNYIYLSDLKKVVEALSQPQDSDRDRDDEEPHTNPDGTDDRDDNPTDGRSTAVDNQKTPSFYEFNTLIDKCRGLWNNVIFDALKSSQPESIERHLNIVLVECMTATTDVLLDHFQSNTLNTKLYFERSDWIVNIANKTSAEYIKTLFKNPQWKEVSFNKYFKDQFNSNPRLSKIINALLKSCINYTKYNILISKGKSLEWVVNSNECGHKGRIKQTTTLDKFQIGVTKIRFPGEVLSFNCDCTITNKE